jgi:hypothetical protein
MTRKLLATALLAFGLLGMQGRACAWGDGHCGLFGHCFPGHCTNRCVNVQVCQQYNAFTPFSSGYTYSYGRGCGGCGPCGGCAPMCGPNMGYGCGGYGYGGYAYGGGMCSPCSYVAMPGMMPGMTPGFQPVNYSPMMPMMPMMPMGMMPMYGN